MYELSKQQAIDPLDVTENQTLHRWELWERNRGNAQGDRARVKVGTRETRQNDSNSSFSKMDPGACGRVFLALAPIAGHTILHDGGFLIYRQNRRHSNEG